MAFAFTQFVAELRQASRSLLRQPGYLCGVSGTLALGIGSTVAVFAFLHSIVLRPLPYDESDRLVSVHHIAPGLGVERLEQSPGMIRFYRARASFLTDFTAYDVFTMNFSGEGEPRRVRVVGATPELFAALRIAPVAGRALTASDASVGAPPVALISYELWRDRFGLAPGTIGTVVRFDGVATEVVGVLPPRFAFADPTAVALVPLSVDPGGAFGSFGVSGFARLADDVSLAQAQRRIEQLQSQIPDYFDTVSPELLANAQWAVRLERLRDRVVPKDDAKILWLVFGAAALVLLIVAANVTNLALLRSESRKKELALRTALGAGLRALAATAFSEAAVLATLGGVLGVVIARVGVAMLAAYGPASIPRLHEVRLDGLGVGLAAALTLVAAILIGGLLLARAPRRPSAVAAMRGAPFGRYEDRARDALVAGQFALALVLVVAAGLMLRSAQAIRQIDLGIDAADVMTVRVSLDEGKSLQEAVVFYTDVARQFAALPGVSAVGLSTALPMGRTSWNGGSFYLESRPRPNDDFPPVASYKAIGFDYLEALDQRLLEGRSLERSDWEGGAPVALVNETFARTFLDGHAIGEGLKWDEASEFARIVGVVADVPEQSITEDPRPLVYLPLIVGRWGYPGLANATFVVEAEHGAALQVSAIRDIVRRLDASVPTNIESLDAVLSRAVAQRSFTTALTAIGATAALVLGAVGLFGIMSYAVAQRTREIALRVALGAKAIQIQRMVLRRALTIVVLGATIGVAGGLGATRVIEPVLYATEPTDLPTFVTACLVLAGIAIVAAWLPARWAARIDPATALRAD